MTQKMSEILLDAAELLWDGNHGAPVAHSRPAFICQALAIVQGLNWSNEFHQDQVKRTPASRFLVNLGMGLGGRAFTMWDDDAPYRPLNLLTGYEMQQVRYAWLQLAAQVAEEEGL